MIVVSDTSPITSLIQIGRLNLVNLVFGQVVIPEKVFEELCKVPIKAEEMGLQIVGVLGIFIRAKKLGHIESVKTLTDELIEKADFYLNSKHYQHILELAGESL